MHIRRTAFVLSNQLPGQRRLADAVRPNDDDESSPCVSLSSYRSRRHWEDSNRIAAEIILTASRGTRQQMRGGQYLRVYEAIQKAP